jgi:hypothetical protein
MRKYKVKKVTQKTYTLISTTCDRCKKVIDPDDIVENQEICFIRFTGGYGSVFGDGAEVECDICQRCLKELIGGFYRAT